MALIYHSINIYSIRKKGKINTPSVPQCQSFCTQKSFFFNRKVSRFLCYTHQGEIPELIKELLIDEI